PSSNAPPPHTGSSRASSCSARTTAPPSPLPRPPQRARDQTSPRRLPRPREPGLHRELVRETQRTRGLAERIRDPRRRPPRDRRLRRPLPPPAALTARLPDTQRGPPDLGRSTQTPNTK